MLRILLCMFVLLLATTIASAQIDFSNLEDGQIYGRDKDFNTWSVTLGYGPVIYYTDMVNYSILPSDNWRFGTSLALAKQFGRSWAVEGQFLTANMYGEKFRRYFTGDFREGTVNVKAYLNQLILNGPMRDRWNVYAKAGIGVNFFRSSMRSLGEIDEITGVVIFEPGQVLTADYFLPVQQGYPTAYTGWNPTDYLVMGYRRDQMPLQEASRQSDLVFPLGVGVRYRLNDVFNLGLETTLRNFATDNLDVDLTGADNDSYMYTSFSLTYIIGRRDRRHSSWTYKDFNLAFERQRERDPLVQRLDSLRQYLDYLAARDTVVRDTTFTNIERVVRQESLNVSVFFDFDKHDLLPAGKRTLAGVARYMRANPDSKFLLLGFTDERGSDEYNVALSERRIKAVKDLLVNDFGIDASRFRQDPRGETELLSNTRKLAPRGVHLVNRRVDVILINEQ